MLDVFSYTGKTFTAEEQKDRAAKALAVASNGLDSIPILYPIGQLIGDKVKPTILIKRIKNKNPIPIIRLKGASAIQNQLKREREKAEKALKLNSLFS